MVQHMEINQCNIPHTNHMIVSVEPQNMFDKNSTFFYDKKTQNTRTKKKLPQLIKVMYEKPTPSILNGEKLRAFSLRSVTKLPTLTTSST